MANGHVDRYDNVLSMIAGVDRPQLQQRENGKVYVPDFWM